MTCWFSLPLSPEVHQWPLFCTDQGVAWLREYLCCSFNVRLIDAATIANDICEDSVKIFVAQILILLIPSFHLTPSTHSTPIPSTFLLLILPFFCLPPMIHTLTFHSWYTYSAMNRIYKHYAFNISRSPATTVMSFSSSPEINPHHSHRKRKVCLHMCSVSTHLVSWSGNSGTRLSNLPYSRYFLLGKIVANSPSSPLPKI